MSIETSVILKVSSRLFSIVTSVLSTFYSVTGERILGIQLPLPFLNLLVDFWIDFSGVTFAVNILLSTAVYLFDNSSSAWSSPLIDLTFKLSGFVL